MVKFLIIRFSSIGDIVLTTPVIRCLKQQVEDAEIHFLTKKEYGFILEKNPYISKVHLLDNNLNELIKTIKYEHFDHIIDLHKNLRTARVKNKLSLPAFTFDKLNYKKWLLVNFKINKMPDLHIVDRYLETVKVFDVRNDGKGLDYFIPSEDEINPEEIHRSLAKGYVAIAIGGQWFTKQMPAEKLVSIIGKIKFPVVLLGGKGDVQKAAYCREKLPNIIDLTGKLNLNGSSSIVKQANIVITNDTGLMHIAAAFGRKIVSVWGNTVPEFGMYPYLPGIPSIISQVNDLKCRPCTKIGFRSCPKKHFNCMNMQNEDVIVEFVEKYFSA
jgi:ADP-heptose:LPS heptosyltransferase